MRAGGIRDRLVSEGGSVASASARGRRRRVARHAEGEGGEQPELTGSSPQAVILPVGPFCPFRSSFSSSETMESEMDSISSRAAGMAQRFAPMMLDAQMGKEPNPELVKPLAEEMIETNDLWKVTLARMRLTPDFQGLEFYKLTQAQLGRQGLTLELMQELMAWQMEGMVAFCEKRPPPPPPAGAPPELLAGMMSGSGPNLSQMAGASGADITALPFDMAALESDIVRDELEKLTEDHKQLIKMGENYGSFDPSGKVMYLDQVEAVESRWEVFMARFRLMGQLNPQYVKEAELYLQKVSMTPNEFRDLLKEAHNLMREDAEREALAR